MHSTPEFTHIYGNFSIDKSKTVYVNGSPVSIRPIDLAMLVILLNNGGDPISRKRIAILTNRPETVSRGIDISASRLRSVLASEGWRIQSVRRIGYRFDTRKSQD